MKKTKAASGETALCDRTISSDFDVRNKDLITPSHQISSGAIGRQTHLPPERAMVQCAMMGEAGCLDSRQSPSEVSADKPTRTCIVRARSAAAAAAEEHIRCCSAESFRVPRPPAHPATRNFI